MPKADAAHCLIDAMRKHNAQETAAMNARFAQVDIDRFLKPDEVVKPAEVLAGRAELAKFRAALHDRDQLADDQQARVHALFNALPAGALRDGALLGESRSVGRVSKMRATLTQAQNANADAVAAMFDWADANHAVIQSRGGHLVVYNPAALADLRSLGDRLQTTVAAVDAATAALKAEEAASVTKLETARRDIDK